MLLTQMHKPLLCTTPNGLDRRLHRSPNHRKRQHRNRQLRHAPKNTRRTNRAAQSRRIREDLARDIVDIDASGRADDFDAEGLVADDRAGGAEGGVVEGDFGLDEGVSGDFDLDAGGGDGG